MSAVSCILNHLDFIMCCETAWFFFKSKIEILGNFSSPVLNKCVFEIFLSMSIKKLGEYI